MNVIGIVQARMSSGRFPGKILGPILDRPMLQVQAQRLRSARVRQWWLATTTDPRDDVTVEWGRALGFEVHRGEMEDVLARFVPILRECRPDWFVRVTSDCPFTDGTTLNVMLDMLPELPDQVAVFSESFTDRRFPLGYIQQIARTDAVLDSVSHIPTDHPYHRSHILTYLYEQGRSRVFRPGDDWPARPHWRLTVDTVEDLNMAQAAFRCFSERWASLSYFDLVEALDARPDIVDINQHVRQKQLCEG